MARQEFSRAKAQLGRWVSLVHDIDSIVGTCVLQLDQGPMDGRAGRARECSVRAVGRRSQGVCLVGVPIRYSAKDLQQSNAFTAPAQRQSCHSVFWTADESCQPSYNCSTDAKAEKARVRLPYRNGLGVSRKRSMFVRGLRCLLLLTTFVAPSLPAQLPSALQQSAPAGAASDDPLGRSTPRGTVVGFIRAANRGNYEQAASYLDTKQRGELAEDLAQQLQTVLDRGTSIELNKLSSRPEGSQANIQNPNRELVGVATTSSGKLQIWLDRVQRGDNPPIWLFSPETLRLVPERSEDFDNAPEIEEHLPSWLKTKPLLSLPLWRWGFGLLSLPLIVVLGSLVDRFLKTFLTDRILGGVGIAQTPSVVAPLRLILFGIWCLLNGSLSYTLLGRNFWHSLGKVVIVFGVTWLSMRVVGIVSDLALARLKRNQSSDKIAMAALLGRLSQIGVLTAGILTVMYLAGVNLAAALAGLGIGGLAVAFAAQKTLENLFGGFMIISDRPVRIGDMCKIGDVTGSVVDIGLRSTRIRTQDRTIVTIPNGQLATMNLENYTLRDKFWFHPTIALRHQTTVEQMQEVLRRIREMLDKHAHVEPETVRVRFVSIGTASQDVEVFAYVFAAAYAEFLGIQEDLLLQILEMVESAGTGLALPIRITHVVRDSDAELRSPKNKTIAVGES
jgi:MscS family membrane protein